MIMSTSVLSTWTKVLLLFSLSKGMIQPSKLIITHLTKMELCSLSQSTDKTISFIMVKNHFLSESSNSNQNHFENVFQKTTFSIDDFRTWDNKIDWFGFEEIVKEKFKCWKMKNNILKFIKNKFHRKSNFFSQFLFYFLKRNYFI